MVTVSSSRAAGRPEPDVSGSLAERLIREAGHEVSVRAVVPDSVVAIRRTVSLCASESDVVLLLGGTGIHPQDVTPEACRSLFSVEMPGFGEIFRTISFEEVGSAAFLSRACAGRIGGSVVFCLPGSPGAVEVALRRLIIPEAAHAVWTARGYSKVRSRPGG